MSKLPSSAGPFSTWHDAYEACRDITGTPGTGYLTEGNRARLLTACEAAGVELGAYDRRILDWLSRWEPETVAVISGIITRAARGGAE